MNCKRCGNRMAPDEKKAMVTRWGAPLEPCMFFYLCENCHRSLLAWANVRPDTPDLWRTPEPEGEPPRPFSCYDERLTLHG